MSGDDRRLRNERDVMLSEPRAVRGESKHPYCAEYRPFRSRQITAAFNWNESNCIRAQRKRKTGTYWHPFLGEPEY
jgi:hypothetical protein